MNYWGVYLFKELKLCFLVFFVGDKFGSFIFSCLIFVIYFLNDFIFSGGRKGCYFFLFSNDLS